MNNGCAAIVRYLSRLHSCVLCMYACDNFDILLFEIEMEVGVMDGTGDDS